MPGSTVELADIIWGKENRELQTNERHIYSRLKMRRLCPSEKSKNHRKRRLQKQRCDRFNSDVQVYWQLKTSTRPASGLRYNSKTLLTTLCDPASPIPPHLTSGSVTICLEPPHPMFLSNTLFEHQYTQMSWRLTLYTAFYAIADLYDLYLQRNAIHLKVQE